MPTNGFSTKPQKVKLLVGEQKATELRLSLGLSLFQPEFSFCSMVEGNGHDHLRPNFPTFRFPCVVHVSSLPQEVSLSGQLVTHKSVV